MDIIETHGTGKSELDVNKKIRPFLHVEGGFPTEENNTGFSVATAFKGIGNATFEALTDIHPNIIPLQDIPLRLQVLVDSLAQNAHILQKHKLYVVLPGNTLVGYPELEPETTPDGEGIVRVAFRNFSNPNNKDEKERATSLIVDQADLRYIEFEFNI